MLSVATVEILMLVRTWALYSKSRKVGIILLTVWLIALGGCILVVKSSIKPIPGVIPLDPIYINPCDRPSPYKYFITYVIVLCFELFSFIIMMVRINSLASRSQSTNTRGRVRNKSARPLIPTIQKHGLYYFTCVVCVMTLNVVASFSKSLSRIVINAGMGPIIASIACNRVIFALHGLYTEIDHGPGRSALSSFKAARPPSGNQNHRHLQDHGPSERSIKYEDEDIARTRQDLTTRDLGVNEYRRPSLPNNLHEVEAEGYVEKENMPTVEGALSPNSISKFTSRPQLPLHGHHTSWSTTQSSKEFTSDSKSTSMLHRSRSTAPTIDSQTPLHRSPSSDAHLPKPNSPVSTSDVGAKETSRGHRSSSSFGTVVRSLSRGGGPRSPIMRVFARSTHTGDGNTPTVNRDPGAMEAGLGPEMSSGESSTAGGKRPPWWQRSATSNRGEELETRGKEKDKGFIKGRPRGRERHPLDHQYEMDTILTGGSGDFSGFWSPTETQVRPLETSQMTDDEGGAFDAPRRHLPVG